MSSGPIGDPANDNPRWNEPQHTIGSVPVEPHGMMQRSMAEDRDRRGWGEIRASAEGVAAELRVAR